MTWDNHIREKCNTAMKRVTLLKRLALKVPRSTKLNIYTSFIRPVLEYGSVLFDNCSAAMSEMIENVQRQASLTITGAYAHTSNIRVLKEVGLSLLSRRRIVAKITLIFKIIRSFTPSYLRTLLPDTAVPNYTTRQHDDIQLPLIKKNYLLKSFIPSSIRLWNSLETKVKTIAKTDNLKNALRKIFTPEVLYKPYGATQRSSYI